MDTSRWRWQPLFKLLAAQYSRLKTPKRFWRLLGLVAIGTGSVCLLVVVITAVYPLDPVYPSLGPLPAPAREGILPTHLTIPTQGLSLTITEGSATGDTWDVSRTGISHLASSAAIGSGGNIVLYGHNWRGLLATLPAVTPGEQIVVTGADDTTHTFVVTETFEVAPTDVHILTPTDTETLTLYTCSGLFNQRRHVVRAVPVKT